MIENTKEAVLAVINSIISLLEKGDARIQDLEKLYASVQRGKIEARKALRKLDRYTWAKFSGDPQMERVLDARHGRLLAMH